jgi:hypothetical protein
MGHRGRMKWEHDYHCVAKEQLIGNTPLHYRLAFTRRREAQLPKCFTIIEL